MSVREITQIATPARAGGQESPKKLDSSLHGNDGIGAQSVFLDTL
jgi:hypothetical protein